MIKQGWFKKTRVALAVAAALVAPGLGSAHALAKEPIVGLWEVTVTLAGLPVLHSFETWSSDGNQSETTLKPVLGGNVCLGLWTSLGKQSYGLTHPVYNFDDTPDQANEGAPTGTSGNLMYRITVARDGNSFSGNAVFRIYDGIDPFDPTENVLATLSGTVTAKRLTVDTTLLP